MPRPKNLSADAVLYAVGLVATCSLAWLGYMAMAVPDVRSQGNLALGPAGLVWFVPAAYLAAWQFLVFRNLAAAIAGTMLLTALSIGTFFFAGIAGLFSLGLLVFPAAYVGIAVMVAALARIERADTDHEGGAVPARLHAVGAIAFVVMPIMFIVPSVPAPWIEPSWRGVGVFIGGLLATFAPHGVLTWAWLQRHGGQKIKPTRVLGLVATAWAVPAAMLAGETRTPAALLWPAQAISFMAFRKADLDLFSRVGEQQTGFLPGESFTTELERRQVRVKVPAEWLATNARHPPTRGGGWRNGASLVPDPRVDRQAASPATRISVNQQPSLRTALPAQARSALKHPRLWREFGCASDNVPFDGLAVCRQVVLEAGDSPSPPLIARFPEVGLPLRVMLDKSGFGVDRTYYLAGSSAWAECRLERECRFWFPAGERSAVWVTMPETEVHRWREARAEADAVARAAVGFGLASRPTLEQPDGEVLPLASR